MISGSRKQGVTEFGMDPTLPLVFGIFGLSGAACLLVSLFVGPHDWFPLVCIGIIYVLFGSLAFALPRKVEISDTRITIMRGRRKPAFSVRWDQIVRYERDNKYDWAMGYWRLSTADADEAVPQWVEEEAELHRLILLHLPAGVVVAPLARQYSGVRRGDPIRVRRVSWISACIAGLGLLFMISLPVLLLVAPQQSRSLGLFMTAGLPLGLIGLLAIPALWKGLREILKGSLTLSDEQVSYDNGTSVADIPWSELLMFESRVSSTGQGATICIRFIGRSNAISMSDEYLPIGKIERFAASHAPDSAFVLLTTPPGEPMRDA